MDNKVFDITSVGKEDFDLAMKIAISAWKKTVGFRVHENHLVLYWVKSDKCTLLPYEMNVDETIAFAWGWFEKSKIGTREPDHDGDNEKGFRIFCESWGHVFHEYEAYVAITPEWAMYGK